MPNPTIAEPNYQEKFGLRMKQIRDAKEIPTTVNIRQVLWGMPYSGKRRELIVQWFAEAPTSNRIRVNDHYSINLKYDTDFQRLLKEEKIKAVRVRKYGKSFSKIWKHAGKAETLMVAKDF